MADKIQTITTPKKALRPGAGTSTGTPVNLKKVAPPMQGEPEVAQGIDLAGRHCHVNLCLAG